MYETDQRSKPQIRLGYRQLLVSLVMLSALFSLLSERDWQAKVSVRAAEPESGEPVTDATAPANRPKHPTEKQIKAYSGLAALVGIIICGLALGALTILWAGRLRRQLRRPLPNGEHTERDFWFLKPPKPTVTQSSLPVAHQPPHISPNPPDHLE